MTSINLHVNGREHRLEGIEPNTPLLYVLRNDLGLNGVRYGCGGAQCGACTVLIDGVATQSCIVPLERVKNAKVTTLEGLGSPEQPHPVQAAFIAEQAAQCGYCTAGMIVSAAGLLNRNPQPTDEEIRLAMARNLCRCGSHDRVLRAVHRAAGNSVKSGSEV